MLDFDYYNPTHIVFGRDRLGELDNLVPKKSKVLILYGGGSVKKYGTLEKVVKNLPGREIIEFSGVEPNPKFETLMKAAEIVKAEKIDFLLAVGGGSVMDGTKFVSVAAHFKGDHREILFTRGDCGITNATPFGTVVTLPATGSEMNNGAVVSLPEGKFAFFSKLVFPKFSFLDPEMTFTLPKKQIANGIVDTFIHTVEQYVTYPVDARFQDRVAEGILQTLIEIGRPTLDDPTNYDARANLVWCATNGLNGLIGAGVPQDWTTHMIGHELTSLFGIDHGQTLAILQCPIWKVRRKQKHEKLVQYAERVWGLTEGAEEKRVYQAIDNTKLFFESLGVKTSLRDYGVNEKGIEMVLAALEAHGLVALSERKDLDLEQSRKILQLALN